MTLPCLTFRMLARYSRLVVRPGSELVAALEAGVGAEAEVAEATGELGEGLGGHVGVALPADVRGAEELLPGQKRHLRLAEDVHRCVSRDRSGRVVLCRPPGSE